MTANTGVQGMLALAEQLEQRARNSGLSRHAKNVKLDEEAARALRAAATAPAKGDEPVAWRHRQLGAGQWRYGDEKPEGQSVHLFEVQPLYAHPSTTDADCEMAFIEACDEAECRYDNEALLKAIADLKARARPSSDRPASAQDGVREIDDYQPRTVQRLIEILRSQAENPRSWQQEAAHALAALPPGQDAASPHSRPQQGCE